MQKKLIVAPSPFLRNTQVSTRGIMLDVIIAMLPTALAAVWYFGAPALTVMVTCVLSCIVSEWAYQKLTHQPVTVGDLSAIVTGLLLAFNMPASAPWWMGVIGSVVAIVLVKQMFGGIGQNFMNPALAARTVLMLSWTVLMAANVMPQAGQIFGLEADALKAKPIAIIQTVSAEGTSEATGAATGEAAATTGDATAAPATEATTEATGAATGEAAATTGDATAAPATEATTEATGAATGKTAAAPATEATTEATGAATGKTAAAPATEATTEATGAATGETAAAPATEATTEATGAATGETAAAPATEATTEATGAATGETAAAPATEATTEATGAATGEAAAAPATEATTEATGAATGETAAAPATEATAEATAAATAASTEATAEATGAATANSVEATSVATPLSASVQPGDYSLWDLFSGNIPGMLGETCKITLLLGGLYLIFRRVIDWRIPVSFIVTAFILFWIHTGVIYSPESGSQNALYQLLSGGLILGAFFMATDYVTSPITKWGRVIMGVGCALVLYVIRFFNAGYPEGCSFAILFMNVLTPLIDRYTARKPFGYTKPPKAAKEGAANA